MQPLGRYRMTMAVLDSSHAMRPVNASEPHIHINRARPHNIVGGSILDNVYHSDDGGRTWHHRRLESPFGVYGDPVIVSDPGGSIYYF
ncbi:MAG: glycosyl hydrolase, partial [Chlorobi bacterium]|nr:glycosyl hydrolase [Chlorobiota bacterium]